MSLFRGMDEMEESWQDVAPVRSTENVLDTGEKAYQRTQQLLAEAQVVGNILFDGGHGRSRSPDLPRSPDERYYDTLENPQTSTRDADEPEAKTNELSSFLFNDTLATVGIGGSGGGGLGQDAVDRRPEERSFCEAFLQLQEELRSLPPGARVQPRQIKPILNTLLEESEKAQATAAASMARLRELQGDSSPAVALAAATSHELSLETDTWSLLLYLNAAEEEDEAISAAAELKKDRDTSSASDPTDPVDGGADRNDSDDMVMENMWNRDWLYRRTHAVVRWLQHSADSQLESRAPAAFVTRGGKEVGWGRTLEALASGVGGHKNSEVAQMHPDANLEKTSSSRGGGGSGGGGALKVLRLVGQDDLDEEEIVRTMWALVRTGRVKAAKDLCVDRGQPWRAAALGGGGVVGGGVVGTSEDGDPLESAVVFAPGQGLWQDMCWQLSVSLERGINDSEGPAKSVAQHEAAVFAHLAGNADLLLDSDLTQSWEDQAWVRFCSLLHRKILIARIQQRQVQASFSSLYPGVDTLPTDEQLLQRMERSSPPSSHEAVFEVLDDSSQPRVRAEGKGMYRQAQQALILGDTNIPLFLEKILRRVADPGALGFSAATHDERQGGVAASAGGIFAGAPQQAPSPGSQCRSPQLLRFAAHLALVLAAQCPYLTRSDGTQEAIEDVVCAYAEHLGKTQQISLVAVYAATLPLTRRRELYARILHGVEGEHGRTQALEQAKQHMSSDVPAILKKVVEHARLEIPSVAPRGVMQVPEGDLKKIQALSWLLNEEDTRAEAVLQANSLARHFVLQQYQQSAIEGQSVGHSANPLLESTKSTSTRNAGGVRNRKWNRPFPRRSAERDKESADDETTRAAMEDCEETPVILSARIEAVEKLLETAPIAAVGSSSGGAGSVEGKEDVDNDSGAAGKLVVRGVTADAVREQQCWLLLVQARKAYTEWVSTRRAREQGGAGAKGRRGGGKRIEDDNGWAMVEVNDADSDDDGNAVAMRDAAEKAIAAAELVLTFEDGWMYPEEEGASPTSSQVTHGSPAAWPGRNATSLSSANADANAGALVIAKPADASGNDRMIVEYPLAEERDENKERLEEKRKENEVAEARKARERREIERAAREEESAVRLGGEARRKELLAVREACLPGLVFLYHEVVHGTGLWMLKWSDAAAARGWFVRGQTVANVVANDVHRLTEAMSKAQMRRLLRCVERSTTKVIECDERINNVEAF